MSSTQPMSDLDSLTSSNQTKPQRILACIRCQRRKIKCDRRFPCANCSASHVQCVPATLTPRVRRRRRFPERELLEQLRLYETLLRENNIEFKPLHKEAVLEEDSPKGRANDSDNEQPGSKAQGSSSSPPETKEPEKVYEARNLLHALTSAHGEPESDSDSSGDHEIRDIILERSWDHRCGANDHLLFASSTPKVDLSTLHPEPAHMFKLWQIYLDNVHPLLKVTHTSSLQRQIVDAASNVKTINSTLEALMFSIYCMALLSLDVDDDCQFMFGSSREDLLTRFRFGCQQALLNCRFLQTTDRDCLTALYLYLISVEPNISLRSMSSILGTAIRIAQRMKIHSESALAKCTVLEAELRRRLWWSLVLFDSRISMMSDHKGTTLNPTWDCKIPHNINDSDLRPEMKELPAVQEQITDSLFVVVGCELGEFIRHSASHLEFTEPALKPIINSSQHDGVPEVIKLDHLQKRIEDKYFSFCDPENPIHFLTTWFTRLMLARLRLLEFLSRCSKLSLPRTEEQRDTSISYSMNMLESDTNIATSPHVKRLTWLPNLYFPFIAYIQILQDLRLRPTNKHADKAWELMSANLLAHSNLLNQVENYHSSYSPFIKIVLLAWEAREAAFKDSQKPLTLPGIVSYMKEHEAEIKLMARASDSESGSGVPSMGSGEFTMPTSMDFGSFSLLQEIGGQDSIMTTGLEAYTGIPGQSSSSFDMNQVSWSGWESGNNTAAGSAEFKSPWQHY